MNLPKLDSQQTRSVVTDDQEAMKTYVGSTVFKAKPMTRGEYAKYIGSERRLEGLAQDPGYLLEYPADPDRPGDHPDHSGLLSWTPASVFEANFAGQGALAFDQALLLLKEGQAIRRKSWGPDTFLFLLPPGDNIPTRAIHDERLRKVIEATNGSDTFRACGSIRQLLPDGRILTGWAPSQDDMFATDWQSDV